MEFDARTRAISTEMKRMRQTQPVVMSAFSSLASAGTADGALSRKTRELIALGIAIAGRCDDCIGFHVKALVKLGATREELEDVVGTAVYMGGGPSMMYGMHVMMALDEFTAKDSE
ncbi:carboxymuconolactone decarboxylase family protein [Paraburkholderia heleia]|uniref:carboxymuconolactone decarboxylase family protein n=1 Tax=Paraburkholderia heleia TaxID=634127 RepID=UPI002AB7A2DF|nr:carboxymuconolactone decarboxylase family protein [Paraburkholderia heleia]